MFVADHLAAIKHFSQSYISHWHRIKRFVYKTMKTLCAPLMANSLILRANSAQYMPCWSLMHTVPKMMYVSCFVITLDLPTNKQTLLAKKNKTLISVYTKSQDATILI